MPVIIENNTITEPKAATASTEKKEYLVFDETRTAATQTAQKTATNVKVSETGDYKPSEDVIYAVAFLFTGIIIYWIYKSYKNKAK